MKLKALVTLTYPTPETLPIVLDAGGMSKLTPEQAKQVQLKTVEAGQDCSDLPSGSVAVALESGMVEIQTDLSPLDEGK